MILDTLPLQLKAIFLFCPGRVHTAGHPLVRQWQYPGSREATAKFLSLTFTRGLF